MVVSARVKHQIQVSLGTIGYLLSPDAGRQSRSQRSELTRGRTSNIWFLVARTIITFTRADCATIAESWTLPLPAAKAQWEAKSEEAWLRELGSGISSFTTFGQLTEAKKRRSEAFYGQCLDSWNAEADHLGFLLNLAVTMA